MINLMKKFWKEEDGATIIEYVLMLAVAAGIVMFAFPNLRTALVGWMTGMFGNVTDGLDTDSSFGTTSAASMCATNGGTWDAASSQCN